MALWKDKTRGYWRYAVQVNGVRVTGSGFKTKQDARAAREKRRKELLDPNKTKTGMAFSDVANLYLDYATRKFAKKTYEYKAMVFRCFLEHGKDLLLSEITPQSLHIYLNTRPTNHNYNAHRKDLCTLFTFARQQLKINIPHPCWDLSKMPYTPPKKDLMSEDDVLKLILASNPETERPLLLTIIHTLARVDEVLRLTWEDVNLENRTVTLWTRKRKSGAYEADLMPMNSDLYDVMAALWKNRVQDKWVFYNALTGDRYNRRPKMMPGICKRAGIKKYGFHHLRHFVATFLADKEKISKKTISGLLRHQNLGTTELYLGSTPEASRMAMEAIEGRFKMDPKPVCASVCAFETKAHTKTVNDGIKT